MNQAKRDAPSRLERLSAELAGMLPSQDMAHLASEIRKQVRALLDEIERQSDDKIDQLQSKLNASLNAHQRNAWDAHNAFTKDRGHICQSRKTIEGIMQRSWDAIGGKHCEPVLLSAWAELAAAKEALASVIAAHKGLMKEADEKLERVERQLAEYKTKEVHHEG